MQNILDKLKSLFFYPKKKQMMHNYNLHLYFVSGS